MRLGEAPLAGVNVELQAEWVQRAYGEFNLYPKIAEKFSQGKVNSLTPTQLVTNWPKVGDKIGPEKTRKKSGYQIIHSHLEAVPALNTGVLKLYPSLSPEISIEPGTKPLRLKQSWFKGELWVDWVYRQKRQETVYFTLHHHTQLEGRIRPCHKSLKIKLQKIEELLPDTSCASFFHTDRGKKAIEHAIERARAYLAGTARCIEVELQTPFEAACDITLDDTVILKGDYIPNGSLRGKVTEYRLEATETQKLVWIRLSVAAGSQMAVSYNPEGSQTLSGISYHPYGDQAVKQGLIDPETLHIDDFVKFIEVKGESKDQIEYLKHHPHKSRTNLQSLLAENPTTIEIELLDLRTHEMLEHRIDLNISYAWSAPCQIILDSGEKV